MARGIVVEFAGEVSAFDITRVDRDKIYGKRRNVVVDEKGEECSQATLTRDGAALLPAGCMAMLYLNDSFEVCERSDLQVIGPDGKPLPEVDSTLGVQVALEGPISARRVLDHLAKAVYELEPEELGATLRARLEAGEIFETRFNYRKGYDDSPAFLMKNEEGFFAVIGDPVSFEYLRNENSIEAEEDESDPFEDDLDFSF